MIITVIGLLLIAFAFFGKKIERLRYIFVIVGTLCVIVGMFFPITGFRDLELVEETEIIPLRLDTDTGSEYFVYICSDGKCLYAYDNGGVYEEDKTEYRHKVTIYESEDCDTPILKQFKKKRKVTWYSFAGFGMWDTNEYVFYIPKGTLKGK